MAKSLTAKPLTSRPLDLVYFIFFVMHIFASLCVDFQPLYPPALVPIPLRQLAEWYLAMSNDPLLKSAFGLSDDPRIWFKSFLFLEVFFQFPTFFIAARGLWNDSQKTYLLILIYAASTATTVWACVATIIATPGLAADELGMLLSSYVPFCVIPLIMTVDIAFRLHHIVAEALIAQQASKSK